MTLKISFTKMVGAGNDFIVVDARRRRLDGLTRRWAAAGRVLCDRHTGIGADGLLVLEPSRAADVTMRVFNPDGTEAEMCGNGARCVALYLTGARDAGRRAREHRVMVETTAGVLSATVRGERVAMRMTDPTGLTLHVAVPVAGRRVHLSVINTGVPHAVVSVASLDRIDVMETGRALRFHRKFAPRGTNVDFIQPEGRSGDRLRMRTYERGVEGETLACGTGAAAAAIIYALRRLMQGNGLTRRHRVEVRTRSGERLTVSFRTTRVGGHVQVTHLVMEGGARRVFEGTVGWPTMSQHLARNPSL